MQPFTYLLLPAYWSSRNRIRRSERADFARAWLPAAWPCSYSRRCSGAPSGLPHRLDAYDELGDFLLRIGLSWLFLTFLSFLAFQRGRYRALDILSL